MPALSWLLRRRAICCLRQRCEKESGDGERRSGRRLDGRRAHLAGGLGMSPAVREFLLDAPVGFISMYRDAKTHEPVKYYAKVLLMGNGYCFVVDPMSATRRNHHHRSRFPEP